MTITSLNVVDGTVGRNRLPRFKPRYATAVAVVILIVAILATLYYTGVLQGKSGRIEVLIPPNPTKDLPPSRSALHTFKKGAVCADGTVCAQIGRDILLKNGSAVDATLAALFCNGMVTMQSMGLGGGFLMTIYKKDENKAYFLNAREKAPINASSEFYKDDPLKSQTGPLSIAVPGELRGYWEAHKRFGKLQWKDLIEPTVKLCEAGYNITDHQYMSMSLNKLAKTDPNIKEWLVEKDGSFKKPGTTVTPTKLCKTLKLIAENGGDDLYNGTLSKMFAEDLKEVGSLVTIEDLREYQPEWKEPVSVKFANGDQLFSVPPPGSGILLAFILNILDRYNFDRFSIMGLNNTVLTYHRMMEAFKYAYAKRTELGDTNFVNISQLMQNLTSNDYANSIRLKIRDNHTSSDPKDYGAVFYNKEDHGTAHVSVLSPDGDAVSVTSSVNIYFGAGITSKQTGIIFNSVMDDFSFPYFKNYFGLPGSPNNEMKPGKRPLSSMSPSIIVDKNGDVRMVVGAAGGTRITTAVAQVIMRTLWFGQNIKEAVDAPRLHHQVYPTTGSYEYGLLQQIVDGLESIGHILKRDKPKSVVCALIKQLDKIMANADHRRHGDVFGVE